MVDWLNRNSVEMLNDIYNLSFQIKEVTKKDKYLKMELITAEEDGDEQTYPRIALVIGNNNLSEKQKIDQCCT
jgi:hypothetical protein